MWPFEAETFAEKILGGGPPICVPGADLEASQQVRRAQLASPAHAHPIRAGTFPQVRWDDLLTDARVALRTTDLAPRRLLHVEEEVSPPPLTPTPIPPQVPMADDLPDRHGRLLQLLDCGERLPDAHDPTLRSNPLTGPDAPCLTGLSLWWRLLLHWVGCCCARAVGVHACT